MLTRRVRINRRPHLPLFGPNRRNGEKDKKIDVEEMKEDEEKQIRIRKKSTREKKIGD